MSVSFFEKKRDCKGNPARHYLGIVDIIWTLRYSVTMEEGHAQTSQASYQPCDLHAHPAWLYNISDAIKKERNLSASIYLIILSCPSSRPERTKAVSVFICMNTPIFMVALSLRTNTQSLTIAARRRDHFRKKFPGGKIQFETKDQRDQPYPIAFGPSATPQASLASGRIDFYATLFSLPLLVHIFVSSLHKEMQKFRKFARILTAPSVSETISFNFGTSVIHFPSHIYCCLSGESTLHLIRALGQLREEEDD